MSRFGDKERQNTEHGIIRRRILSENANHEQEHQNLEYQTKNGNQKSADVVKTGNGVRRTRQPRPIGFFKIRTGRFADLQIQIHFRRNRQKTNRRCDNLRDTNVDF